MSQLRVFDYGAPRRTTLLNHRFVDILPSRGVITGYDVTATGPASLDLNIGLGALIDQDGVVIKEDADLPLAVTIAPDSIYPRIDYIVAQHEYNVAVESQTYAVIEGTASTPPVPPTLPDYAVKLAEVYVPAYGMAITDDMIFNVAKSSADASLITRDHIKELQVVSTSELDSGVSDKVFVRGGKYLNSAGTATVEAVDQLSPSFAAIVTPGNERIDLVVLDDNGLADIVAGTEAAPGAAMPPNYPDDTQVVAEVFVNETDYEILIGPSDIRDVRYFFNLGGSGGVTQMEPYDVVATAGQTVFNLPWSYTPGNGQLLISSSGVVQTLTLDYTESSSSTVTFVTARSAGENISFRKYEFIVSGTIEGAISGTVKSQLVNGGMKIWQRGAGPFTVDAEFGPDEWGLAVDWTCSLLVSKNTAAMKYGSACAEATVTKGAGDARLVQGIESYKSLEGATMSFSMWVKSSTAACVRIGIGDYAGADQEVFSSYHSGGGGWERLVVTKTIRAALAVQTAIPHDFGLWVFVDFQASEAGLLLDGGMLAVGTSTTGYVYVPIGEAEEMERCQRFYETGKTFGYPAYDVNSYDPYMPYNVGQYVSYKTFKYDVPIVTIDNWIWGYGTTPGTSGESQKGFRLTCVAGDDASDYSCDWVAEVEI